MVYAWLEMLPLRRRLAAGVSGARSGPHATCQPMASSQARAADATVDSVRCASHCYAGPAPWPASTCAKRSAGSGSLK